MGYITPSHVHTMDTSVTNCVHHTFPNMMDIFSGFFALLALGAFVMGIVGLSMMRGNEKYDMLVWMTNTAGDQPAWHAANIAGHAKYVALDTTTTFTNIANAAVVGTLGRISGTYEEMAALHASWRALAEGDRDSLYLSAPEVQNLAVPRVRVMHFQEQDMSIVLDTGSAAAGVYALQDIQVHYEFSRGLVGSHTLAIAPGGPGADVTVGATANVGKLYDIAAVTGTDPVAAGGANTRVQGTVYAAYTVDGGAAVNITGVLDTMYIPA